MSRDKNMIIQRCKYPRLYHTENHIETTDFLERMSDNPRRSSRCAVGQWILGIVLSRTRYR